MEPSIVKAYFNQEGVVRDYLEATEKLGLWESEKIVFSRLFEKEAQLLELGCGTGRIAIGLWDMGYRKIVATDCCLNMVLKGHQLNEYLGSGIQFREEDATALGFRKETFDGAIFGFNGLMQIPGRHNRQKALKEIYRVLKDGTYFVFTTHDRAKPSRRKFWKAEAKVWKKGRQYPGLEDFGDVYYETPHGRLFIHIPTREEVRMSLEAAGFLVESDMLRSEIAEEAARVFAFSDECRFWIAQKPIRP